MFNKSEMIKVNRELARVIKVKLLTSQPLLEQYIKEEIEASLKRNPTYDALTTGILVAHFGFRKSEASSRIDDLIERLIDEVVVVFDIIDGNGALLFTLNIEVTLNYEVAYQFSESIVLNRSKSTGESEQLMWLEWLLKRGTSAIILNYDIEFGDFPTSRSEEAIMVESPISWLVPGYYAGTEESNWITQSFEDAIEPIINHTKTMILSI